MAEPVSIKTKVSKGYQVVVPSEIRKTYGVKVGDEVVWTVSDESVSTTFRKKPGLENLISMGRSGRKDASAVELKKRVQKGAV